MTRHAISPRLAIKILRNSGRDAIAEPNAKAASDETLRAEAPCCIVSRKSVWARVPSTLKPRCDTAG